MDKPNLRHVFCAQNPVLPQWLKPRRLRDSSAVEMGRKKGSSDRTSLNPDNGHRLDSGSITLNKSPQNSVDQPEASHASVCLHGKTPEIDISLTPLHANMAEFSPPVSERKTTRIVQAPDPAMIGLRRNLSSQSSGRRMENWQIYEKKWKLLKQCN